jgi:UDP-N-acetylglucosamine--N-acetylmuramyl-(pentapeptide) pyrophosphoryl-undecaprenol N-acetylglucosamine transferase
MFVGTSSGIESRVVPESGYRLELISSRGARGKGAIGKIVTGVMMAAGIMQSMRIMKSFRPDIVFGSGGYASFAAVSAAWIMRKTVVLQEQNSIPGLANRILAPMARRLYLGFERAGGYFKKDAPVMVTGNPLRSSIKPAGDSKARGEFGLDGDRPVLLVFGGSQGAMTLSRAAAGYLIDRADLQAIVQTGEKGYMEIRDLLSGVADRVFVCPYIGEIANAYAAADVALARAGALSVSELAAAGVPSVLVPYPHCADDHQRHNASVLVDAGGAVMIEDSRLDAASLAEELDPLLDNPDMLERMRVSLRPFQGRRAAAAIADDMERLAGGVER